MFRSYADIVPHAAVQTTPLSHSPKDRFRVT
jgi:hypothetical protein